MSRISLQTEDEDPADGNGFSVWAKKFRIYISEKWKAMKQ